MSTLPSANRWPSPDNLPAIVDEDTNRSTRLLRRIRKKCPPRTQSSPTAKLCGPAEAPTWSHTGTLLRSYQSVWRLSPAAFLSSGGRQEWRSITYKKSPRSTYCMDPLSPIGLDLKRAKRAPEDSLKLRRPRDHSRRLGNQKWRGPLGLRLTARRLG